jgi:hypothetical protein
LAGSACSAARAAKPHAIIVAIIASAHIRFTVSLV